MDNFASEYKTLDSCADECPITEGGTETAVDPATVSMAVPPFSQTRAREVVNV